MDPFRRWWQLSGFTRVRGSDRFWRKVAMTNDPASCWLWLNGRDSQGYGTYSWHGRMRPATHVAWELVHGEPVPEGMKIRHKCDNPSCCRPTHLEMGTHRDNMQDMKARGRWRSRVLTHEQVLAIRVSTATIAKLAQEFGVDTKTIRDVQHCKTYRYVEG